MEAFMALVAAITVLAVLDIAAVLVGAESRDGFVDDCLTTTLS